MPVRRKTFHIRANDGNDGLCAGGKKRAYVAVAHSMLIAIYHILKDGVVFKDLGADYYNQFNKEREPGP